MGFTVWLVKWHLRHFLLSISSTKSFGSFIVFGGSGRVCKVTLLSLMPKVFRVMFIAFFRVKWILALHSCILLVWHFMQSLAFRVVSSRVDIIIDLINFVFSFRLDMHSQSGDWERV